MRKIAVALLAGILFGFGLALSGMRNPAVVLAFLDVTGDFDPSLAFVMGGALLVTVPGFRPLLQKSVSWRGEPLNLPVKTAVDKSLITGACLFGIGWGMAGICPGPAVAGLISGDIKLIAFVLALGVGMLTYRLTLGKES